MSITKCYSSLFHSHSHPSIEHTCLDTFFSDPTHQVPTYILFSSPTPPSSSSDTYLLLLHSFLFLSQFSPVPFVTPCHSCHPHHPHNPCHRHPRHAHYTPVTPCYTLLQLLHLVIHCYTTLTPCYTPVTPITPVEPVTLVPPATLVTPVVTVTPLTLVTPLIPFLIPASPEIVSLKNFRVKIQSCTPYS